VLGQEPVHQPTRRPAGKGTGDRRGYVAGRECREVERVRPALRAGQEHRAQLRGTRAGDQHSGHVGTVRQPAGRDERDIGHSGHLAQQRDQAGVVDALVREVAPVGAGFLPLHAQPVGPRRHRLACLVGRGDGHEDLGAAPLDLGDHLGRWAAEREADDRHTGLGQQRELGVPVVVPARRVAERDAVPRRLGRQPCRVPGHGVRVHPGPLRYEDVEPERLVRQLAGPGQLVPDGVRLQVAGGEIAQATGVRHRGGELRRGAATGHRRLHDRLWQLVEDRHGSSPGKSWPVNRIRGVALTAVSATSSSGADSAMIAPPTP
jgi:hypothetical protein